MPAHYHICTHSHSGVHTIKDAHVRIFTRSDVRSGSLCTHSQPPEKKLDDPFEFLHPISCAYVHTITVSRIHTITCSRIRWFTGSRMGFDHRVGHFRPLRMTGLVPKPPFLQVLRLFHLGYWLLGWPTP